MSFPEPVISVSIEPKTKVDQEKLGIGAGQAHPGGPDLPGAHRARHRPDPDLGHGRAAPGDHHRPAGARVRGRRQRRQAAGRLPRDDHHRGRGRGALRPPDRRPRPVRPLQDPPPPQPRARLRVQQQGGRRPHPQGVHQADRAGDPRGAGDRPAGRLSDVRGRGRRLRRQLPRRRLLGGGVQDRRLDGVPGRLEAGAPGADGAGDGGRGGHPRGVHGRGDRRHHLAPRPGAADGGAGQRPGDHLQGAALRDVRLRHRPAVADPGAGELHDAVLGLRAGAEERRARRSSPRPPAKRGATGGTRWARQSSSARSRT